LEGRLLRHFGRSGQARQFFSKKDGTRGKLLGRGLPQYGRLDEQKQLGLTLAPIMPAEQQADQGYPREQRVAD
jgi:hypothetical protein